jgi:hypothetical protein
MSELSTLEHEIIVLALAKNCLVYLQKFTDVMLSLHRAGINAVAVVGENGSTDGSTEFLESEFAKQAKITRLDTSSMSDFASRLERMAHGREMLLSFMVERGMTSEYVLVIDVDDVMEGINAETITKAIRTIENRNDIFAVTPKSKPYYYDVLAYRSENICTNPAFIFDKNANIPGFVRAILYYYIVDKVSKFIDQNEDHYVYSAFNGFSLYRYDNYKTGTYESIYARDVCEHVTFNMGISLRYGKWVFVSKDIEIDMPKEHDPRLLVFLSRQVRKLIKFTF